MLKPLPPRVDPFRLADNEALCAGTLELGALRRLKGAVLGATDSGISVELRFSRDGAGRCIVEGEAAAELTFTCQRCMEPVSLPVRAEFRLAVVTSEAEAAGLPEDTDARVQTDRMLESAALVEDELLLALPIVPVHADITACGERAAILQQLNTQAEPPAERSNPFAVLRSLKKSH